MTHQRMLIWSGETRLPGQTGRVVVLATFDTTGRKHSTNIKTGNMVQLWVLREDVSPGAALAAGQDTTVCGDCVNRSTASGGNGACYVEVYRAPRGVWAAYDRGNYIPRDLEMLRGARIRFGAYGDPAAVPVEVWQELAAVSDGFTGYTHQWRKLDAAVWSQWFMASCDSVEDYRQARRAGWRSFLAIRPGEQRPAGLVQCPASDEAGFKTTCAQCLQCSGTALGRRSPGVVLTAHGASARKFGQLPITPVSK